MDPPTLCLLLGAIGLGAMAATNGRQSTQSAWWPLLAAVAAALFASGIAWKANTLGIPSDLDEGLAAARYLRAGLDPYSRVGPGLASPWPWPVYYPLPAIVLEIPLTFMSVGDAHIVFLTTSSAILAWAVARTGNHRLVLFLSWAFLNAALRTQWNPILMAAFLTPPLGFVYAAKPNIGVVLWGARPSRIAVAGSVVLAGVSFALDPRWLTQWLRASPLAPHLQPAVLYSWGWLLLLAALRWRRPEARLFLLLALVPQTLAEYAVLPLFLVTESLTEAIVLALGTVVGEIYLHKVHFATSDRMYIAESGRVIVLVCFLPCLGMLLRRPNEGAVPAWMQRCWRSTVAIFRAQ